MQKERREDYCLYQLLNWLKIGWLLQEGKVNLFLVAAVQCLTSFTFRCAFVTIFFQSWNRTIWFYMFFLTELFFLLTNSNLCVWCYTQTCKWNPCNSRRSLIEIHNIRMVHFLERSIFSRMKFFQIKLSLLRKMTLK